MARFKEHWTVKKTPHFYFWWRCKVFLIEKSESRFLVTFLQKAIVYGTGVRQLNGPLYYTGTQSFISKTSLWLDHKNFGYLYWILTSCVVSKLSVIVISEGVILFMIIKIVHKLVVNGLNLLRIFLSFCSVVGCTESWISNILPLWKLKKRYE